MTTPREIAELHISAASLDDAVNAYCTEAGVDKYTVYYPAMAAAIRAYAATLLAKQAEDARDGVRWKYGVEHGFPEHQRQIHPEVKELGWTMDPYEPDCVYYATAEEAIDAAMQEKTHA